MNNVLNFRTENNQLVGVEGAHMYLGAVSMHVKEFGPDAAITEALRDFNIPHTRAPGDWPADTAHQPLWTYSPTFDEDCGTSRRARWGHD